MLLSGPSGSGKSELLKFYSDKQGYSYVKIDCLAHFNLSKLQSIFSKVIPDMYAHQGLPLLVELDNFHRYTLLLDAGSGAQQSKSAKDLAEMRFV